MQRKNISSGAPWEEIVGYSRAVQVGSFLEIAGTVATDANGEIPADDVAAQTKMILEKIKSVINPDYSRRRALILRLANRSKGKAEFQQET